MAQGFRVAVLGDQGGIGSLLYFSYGLEVFDLSIDQICKLVENPEMGDKATELGVHPRVQYSVMAGGRSYPLVSREEVAKLLQGVEIVIVSMSTRPYYMASLSQEFFNYMFAENLAVNCRHVVIRITKDDDPKERGHQDFGRRHHWSRSGGRVDVEKVLKMYGMEKERIKAKMSIIADGVKASGKKSRNGHAAEDPVKVEVARLRSELTRNELATVLTKPVKETVAVGKSLLGLGQRFGTWIGSLIKGQST